MTGDRIEVATAMAWPRRGGIWRRFLALAVDYLILIIPLYFLVAGLLLAAGGGDHFVEICRSGKVDGGLLPERWQVCKSYNSDFPVADRAVEKAKMAQLAKSETVLIKSGSEETFQLTALDQGFLQLSVLAIYLLVMETVFGRSVGKRALVLVVYDRDNWQRRGLPLQKAFRRQLIKFLGAIPLVLTGAWSAFETWGSVPTPAPSYSWLEVVTTLALIWPLWIGISIALGLEPIHDRIAGTTVRTREKYK
ncbi:RDD family protein [Mesorhizobium sp. RCC_202]|uniref:RDD family protein n=1 Tax=Mesorhizobium sp. RCC_202 TaxID=3239222 RepID=UPI0035250F9D